MKPSPKLLPWLARKAGLSQEKAEALWRDAFANERVTNPDLFFRRVLEHFQQYAAQESTQSASAPSRTAPSQASASKGNRASASIIGTGFALA